MTDAQELIAPLLDGSLHTSGSDPFPHYALLRREAPLARDEASGVWVAATYDEVVAASSDPATFCSGQGVLLFERGVPYDSPPTMLHTDPPAHTRYRALVQPPFRPRDTRARTAAIRRRVVDLVDALPVDESFDVVERLAIPLPLGVIADLLGVPGDDMHRLWQWSEVSIPGAQDWPEEERRRLQGEFYGWLLEAVAKRRAAPPGGADADADIVSRLATGTLNGDALTDRELLMFMVQLLVAGNETTRHTISGGLRALAEQPDQWALLREHRDLVPGAVEEMLRWTSPVTYFLRTATRDVQLGGATIGAGDAVLLLYPSANRDERRFGPTSEQFDVTRTPNPQIAFGIGPHFCLGAPLARLELALVLEELLDRFPHIEPAGELVRSPSPVVSGLRNAPLVLRR